MGHQIVREFVYGLAAVSPFDGELCSLILPWVDTETMSVFLAYTAAQFPQEHCLMLLDGAGWHRALALRVPPTLHLLPLPPYSPELNPVEHLWEYLRENYIGNHVFSSLDAVIDQLSAGLHHLHQHPNLVENMTRFDWLTKRGPSSPPPASQPRRKYDPIRLAQNYTYDVKLVLRVEGSLAARLLQERGLKPVPVREQLAKAPSPKYQRESTKSALLTLDTLLTGLKSLKSEELISFFTQNAEFIDATGKRWNREEIWKGFETLLAPYAKKNASYVVEATLAETSELFVANVLWKNALLASEQRAWMHRMGVVLLPKVDDWQILTVQVTPVQPS